jgi:phospholipid/cholesterol/gamma-HCH transport system permease protein
MIPMLITSATNADRLELAATGSWTSANADRLTSLVDVAASDAARARSITIDMTGVEQLDTLGAWLLERLARSSKRDGEGTRFNGLKAQHHGLIDEMQRVNLQPQPSVERPSRTMMVLDKVGHTAVDLMSDAVEFARLLGELSAVIGRIFLHPRRFRLTSAVYHLFRVGWQAVPIMALITFLIGGIIAQQGFFHFRKFGADSYVVDMVGILVVREIAVLIVSIMAAGRSGAAYTAELGSMKMREEIDALCTMGFDPVEILILPRITALVCALPILSFLGVMAALYGGGLVAWFYGGMSPEVYLARLREAISITHFEVGMIKAPFMALAIGIVACGEGWKVKGSAESLGMQTTTSVVKSIFLVIVLDGIFAMFFASIGM